MCPLRTACNNATTKQKRYSAERIYPLVFFCMLKISVSAHEDNIRFQFRVSAEIIHERTHERQRRQRWPRAEWPKETQNKNNENTKNVRHEKQLKMEYMHVENKLQVRILVFFSAVHFVHKISSLATLFSFFAARELVENFIGTVIALLRFWWKNERIEIRTKHVKYSVWSIGCKRKRAVSTSIQCAHLFGYSLRAWITTLTVEYWDEKNKITKEKRRKL